MSAIGALKGYRTQFLYSLHYILSESDTTIKFRLEGHEDIDVLDADNNLLKIIQVKNLSSPITLSNVFTQGNDRTSFLKRVIAVKERNSKAIPVLVSFGAISKDLMDWSFKRDTKSLKPESWAMLEHELVFIEVEESVVHNEIIRMLKTQYPSTDPQPTAEILLNWISVAAEKQQILSKIDLFKKIELVAEYLSGRISLLQQYGIYFTSLRPEQHNGDSIDSLRKEFYLGVNARYSHIENNLDVERPEILLLMTEAFQRSNVVVLQGASGQGKSTLAYRYAYNYYPIGLVYELNIQEEPENSRHAINSLVQMTRSLESTILLVINVRPDSTQWIKIVREFSSHSRIKFLITIREEDWYKAQSIGIDFLHSDIQIDLTKNEAAAIYSKLNQVIADYYHTDFEEAWIKFGEKGPLLEFVYFITKGKPLEETLTQQIRILEKESRTERTGLLEILKIVCVADSYSASVRVEAFNGIYEAGALIRRLENEYLLKVSADRKSVRGLHRLRSQILLKHLFDDFINKQSDFIIKNLNVIREEDLYHFLLRLLEADIVKVSDLLDKSATNVRSSWASYFAVFKSLIWAGAREYVNENREVLNEAYSKFGDGWTVLIDMYLGDTSPVSSFLNESSFFNDETKSTARQLNARLTDRDDVFKYAKLLLSEIPAPQGAPVTQMDWLAFSQLHFWKAQLNEVGNPFQSFSEREYKPLFEKLSVNSLSILMFGMYYGDVGTKSIRNDLTKVFIDRVKLLYRIPRVEIIDDEISCHYLIDITDNSQDSESLNDRSVEIISVFRKAFPEIKMFKTQGYGHKLELLSAPYDETHKSIPVSNLPNDELVDVNVILRKLFEYANRPDNWEDVYRIMSNWEKKIKEEISKFNKQFAAFYGGRLEYKALASLVENASYTDLYSLLEPKVITDSLGIYYDKKRELSRSGDLQIEHKLTAKYSQFFKAHRDLRGKTVAFLQQSGSALYSILKNTIDKTHPIDEESKRRSIINLFDVLGSLRVFEEQKTIHFSKYDIKYIPRITETDVITIAYTWNKFLGKQFERQTDIASKSITFFNKLKSDFETRLDQQCKAKSKRGLFQLKYVREIKTEHRIIKIDVEKPAFIFLGLMDAYNAVKTAVGDYGYTSLKYLMLKSSFGEFYFLPTVKANTLNKYWYPIPLFAFREYDFSKLGPHYFVGKQIDQVVLNYLHLSDWTTMIPQLLDAKKFLEKFMMIPLITQHLLDIDQLPASNIDQTGELMIENHFKEKMVDFQSSFQYVLDYLAEILKVFPFEEASYNSDELEREYWNALFAIQQNVFPVPKGDEEDYTATINIQVLKDWSDRLKTCTENVILFYFILCGKIIELPER